MIQMLYLAKVLYALTPVGQLSNIAFLGTLVGAAVLDKVELEAVQDGQKKGINSVEELFSEKIHGTIEPIFPAKVVVEELPAGFEKAFGHSVCGDVLWKMSEWNDFWRWVSVLLHNSHSQEKIPVGRDGLWLIEVGKTRWADEVQRRKAFATGAKYKEIWDVVGMWPKQSSV